MLVLVSVSVGLSCLGLDLSWSHFDCTLSLFHLHTEMSQISLLENPVLEGGTVDVGRGPGTPKENSHMRFFVETQNFYAVFVTVKSFLVINSQYENFYWGFQTNRTMMI